ncbi:MAG: type II toxin-antitoxin system RelE/ParE family toxin [Rhizobiaceae bacterium]
MKEITYQPAARKSLRKMPVTTARRIIGKIDAYAHNPRSMANNITTLKGRDGIRLRVGDYRVIMIDGHVLDVLTIAPRGKVYK